AFVYRDGVTSNLGLLIPPNSGWQAIYNATDINNLGQIVGWGILGGQNHAFLLTPAGVWLGGAGNWSDPTRWGVGVIPNSSTVDVRMNHALANSNGILLDQNATVNTIAAAAGDSLTIGSGRT